jgi:hypothetical protein
MRQILTTVLLAIICTGFGFGLGYIFGPQLKNTEQARTITSMAGKVPGLSSVGGDSPWESYEYPLIKWKPKSLADVPNAIAQLHTTYEWTDPTHKSGIMKYRLTMFKAMEKTQCELQLLDNNGFKITQFVVSDFHKIPNAPDIMEARDSQACTEEEYKKIGDYSIN